MCAIYTLNLKTPVERRKRALQMGVTIREHTVFHELLVEMLESAGLPAPVRELAQMQHDGSDEAPPQSKRTARPGDAPTDAPHHFIEGGGTGL